LSIAYRIEPIFNLTNVDLNIKLADIFYLIGFDQIEQNKIRK